MVIMLVMKREFWRPPSGMNKWVFIYKGKLRLPDNIANMDDFAKFIQLKFGEGRFSILGSGKRHGGFYRIFNGTVKKNKAIGSGRIHFYLAKNRERMEKSKNKGQLDHRIIIITLIILLILLILSGKYG